MTILAASHPERYSEELKNADTLLASTFQFKKDQLVFGDRKMEKIPLRYAPHLPVILQLPRHYRLEYLEQKLYLNGDRYFLTDEGENLPNCD